MSVAGGASGGYSFAKGTVPQLNAECSALDEKGQSSSGCGKACATASAQVGAFSLFGSGAAGSALTHSATVCFDAATATGTLTWTLKLEELKVGSIQLRDLGSTGPFSIEVPGVGVLHYGRSSLTTTPTSIDFTAEALRLRLAPAAVLAYGVDEVVLGRLHVFAGLPPPPPAAFPQDDARSRRDAGGDPPAAVPIGAAATDGEFAKGDDVDVFAHAIGPPFTKVRASIAPAHVVAATGGTILVPPHGSQLPQTTSTTTASPIDAFEVRLTDATGGVTYGTPGIADANHPATIEAAVPSGPVFVEVRRLTGPGVHETPYYSLQVQNVP